MGTVGLDRKVKACSGGSPLGVPSGCLAIEGGNWPFNEEGIASGKVGEVCGLCFVFCARVARIAESQIRQ